MKFFGFEIKRTEKEVEADLRMGNFLSPTMDDGSALIETSGVYSSALDYTALFKNEYELINRYRDMQLQPECDSAIDDIVNAAITISDKKKPVEIEFLAGLDVSENIKNIISHEFDEVLKLLDFQNQGYSIFRRWYVDGRIYFQLTVDESEEEKLKEGIKGIRYIDPRQIRKIKEIVRKPDPISRVEVIVAEREYYVYQYRGIYGEQVSLAAGGAFIHPDSIIYVHSDIIDPSGRLILSNLHKAMKPLNQLRMMEDAVVIYRISRAPERRVFYIDVGGMPKTKAEEYMRSIITNYKNKLVYNQETGEMRDDRRQMSMMEDFWIPVKDGYAGSRIDVLQGGKNLSEIEDIQFFQQRLLRSLNVPISRLQSDGVFNLGRATEITRDELKFEKFITRLRWRFSHLFTALLERQLILKNIVTEDEFRHVRENIQYQFASDSYFAESKETEIMKDRIALYNDMSGMVGTYYSNQYVRKKILKQTDKEIEEIDQQILEEANKGEDNPEAGPPVETSGGFSAELTGPEGGEEVPAEETPEPEAAEEPATETEAKPECIDEPESEDISHIVDPLEKMANTLRNGQWKRVNAVELDTIVPDIEQS